MEMAGRWLTCPVSKRTLTGGVTRRGDMGRDKDLWNHFETGLVKHDLEGLLSVFAIDAVYSAPNFRNEGRAAIGAFFDAVFKAFSSTQVDTSLVVEEGDTVVAEWTHETLRPEYSSC
jgi:uncharacterized protein (TIGR02246 family)